MSLQPGGNPTALVGIIEFHRFACVPNCTGPFLHNTHTHRNRGGLLYYFSIYISLYVDGSECLWPHAGIMFSANLNLLRCNKTYFYKRQLANGAAGGALVIIHLYFSFISQCTRHCDGNCSFYSSQIAANQH